MDWSLSETAHAWIRTHLPRGCTIVELGSGEGSAVLAKDYTVFSVEHNPEWMNKFEKVNYIYAPIKKHKQLKGFDHDMWYDVGVLRREFRNINASLYIIDGPPGKHGIGQTGRSGSLKYLDIFREGVPFLIDDLHRRMEYNLAVKISARLKTPLEVHGTWTTKHFGIIWPITGTFANVK